MSAYGPLTRPMRSSPLPSTVWRTNNNTTISVHHLPSLDTAQHQSGLVEYLHAVFAREVQDGLTYPQEDDAMDRASFEAYFFSADVFVAIASGSTPNPGLSLSEAKSGQTWETSLVGFYYIKPNYPGRSSHICNGGFVVPPAHRNQKYGLALANSYVHYAPKLGYTASVFNLVYVNNVASVRLWESLGFTKAGRIPKAGRLRRKDGQGEEYVDAWVFYKSFE